MKKLSELATKYLNNKDWLYEQYITNERSIRSLAKELKCCIPTVSKYMKIYNIEQRNHVDSMDIFSKTIANNKEEIRSNTTSKICSKCKEEKEITEFYKAATNVDGHNNVCKDCVNNANKLWRKENPEQAKTKNKKHGKTYRNGHKEDMNKFRKDWNDKNPDYYTDYAATHKQEKAITDRAYEKKRMANDPLFALSKRIRNSIRQSLRNGKYPKHNGTYEILGCTIEELFAHLENQFIEGMSWDNRELWHVDHIYPVSKAINEEHLLQLNHYTNLQPLWAEDNLKKGDKIPL